MIIDSNKLKATLLAAGKKDVRYYLNGVMLRPNPNGGVSIVATNGHLVFCGVLEGAIDRQVIIPRETIEIALKLKTPTLKLSGNSLGGIPFITVDGTFPDVNRVVPSFAVFTGIGATIDPEYAVSCNKAMNAWDGTLNAIYQVHWQNAEESAILQSEDQKAFIVVMPMRLKSLAGKTVKTFEV